MIDSGPILRRFSGALVRRVVDKSRASIPEHAHDWPLLSIFVMGGYASRTELGETCIAGPSVVLYRAGAFHRNIAGPSGFEQIEIEFDPDWLGPARLPDAGVSQWIGGPSGGEARRLAHLCSREPSADRFRAALRRFMASASNATKRAPPSWVGSVVQRLHGNASLPVKRLAEEIARHPSWVGTAYRRATGERLQETAARFRVERAACLLRETDRPFAAVAAEAGFCDQSHMNRSFRRVLGRSPTEVRNDRLHFRLAG